MTAGLLTSKVNAVQTAERSNPNMNTQNDKTKTVEFSYPTSDNAKRFGFYSTGCYTVETVTGIKPPKSLAGFKTRAEALAHAKTIDLPWSKCFKRYNPNDAREWETNPFVEQLKR